MQIDSLNQEARDFVNDVIEQARSQRPATGEQCDPVETKKVAKKIAEQYNKLSEEAKKSLAEVFPEIVAGIEGAEFQRLAKEEL